MNRVAACVLFVLGVGSVLTWWQWDFVRGYAEATSTDLAGTLAAHPDPDNIGMVRFAYDDLGSLNTDVLQTHATPWKLTSTALLMHRRRSMGEEDVELTPQRLNDLLQEFGFIVPAGIENWHGEATPRQFKRPIGIHTGSVKRTLLRMELEVANIGCSACHAGVSYDETGAPTDSVWLGLPNTSIDLEAFSTAIYDAFRSELQHPEELLTGIRRLYPDVSDVEVRTIQRMVIPRARERVRELEATLGAPTPYSNGSPGLTNGPGALKWKMGVLDGNARDREVGFTSIPDLSDRALRSSLLYDGAYGIPDKPRFAPLERRDITEEHIHDLAEIVSFFTVPAMGTSPESAEGSIPRVAEILAGFLAGYHAPRFPGVIDSAAASRGALVYRERCAECHGSYSPGLEDVRLVQFPNEHVPQSEIGTDSARWQPDPALFPLLRSTRFANHIDPRTTGGYVATPLTGLWATAPYLHNGSVPTLWHLMHPEARPTYFYVGGHRLDFEKVGIDGILSGELYHYREGYQPWSTPQMYDTTKPGLSNMGHGQEFRILSEDEKAALLEYLKLL